MPVGLSYLITACKMEVSQAQGSTLTPHAKNPDHR
jgi:hypothetical protein